MRLFGRNSGNYVGYQKGGFTGGFVNFILCLSSITWVQESLACRLKPNTLIEVTKGNILNSHHLFIEFRAE
jgi:hypothetical protein